MVDGVKTMLDHVGYQVHAFYDPLDAQRAIVDGLLLDALVSDMRMPSLTGADLARWLWQRQPGLPVIFITGFADPDPFTNLPHAFRVLRKPFRLKQLREVLAEVLAEVLPSGISMPDPIAQPPRPR